MYCFQNWWCISENFRVSPVDPPRGGCYTLLKLLSLISGQRGWFLSVELLAGPEKGNRAALHKRVVVIPVSSFDALGG